MTNSINLSNISFTELTNDEIIMCEGGNIDWYEVAHKAVNASGSIIGAGLVGGTTLGIGTAAGGLGGAVVSEILWQVIVN